MTRTTTTGPKPEGRLPTSPVIIMGMHRSGTSMIADLLAELGVFVGADLEINSESRFFLESNDWLLAQADASWCNPGTIDWLLAHEELLALVEDYLRVKLSAWPVRSYLGLHRYLGGARPLIGMAFPWGWKDPRNVFTLPVWLRLFPDARLIYVHRNGVPVAASLRKRTEGGLALAKKQYAWRRRLGWYRWRRKRRGFVYGPRCLTLQGAFSLWEEYVSRAFTLLPATGRPVMSIKYELFVEEPGLWLGKLAAFCGLPESGPVIDRAVKSVRKTRADSFLEDRELRVFYESVKANVWMERLGYG